MNENAKKKLDEINKNLESSRTTKTARTTFKLPKIVIEYIDELRENDYPTVEFLDSVFAQDFHKIIDYVIEYNKENGFEYDEKTFEKKNFAIREKTLNRINNATKVSQHSRDFIFANMVSWSYYTHNNYLENKRNKQLLALEEMKKLLSYCYKVQRDIDNIISDKEDEVYRAMGWPLITLENIIGFIEGDLARDKIVTEEIPFA